MSTPEYIKLSPRRRRTGFAILTVSFSNLWLGPDHLLCVESEGYNESYKRFYFRDIQAFTLRKTPRMLVIAIVTGLFTALFGSIAAAAGAVEAKWIFGILAAVCAVPFGINLIYGDTCQCQLRTAVQIEEVPSLGRVRRARRVIERLRPLIAAAQGELAVEDIPVRMSELLPPASSAPTSTAPTAPASATDVPQSAPPAAG